MSDDKIKVLPPILPQATDELRAALEIHRRNLPFLKEYQQLQAQVTMAKYKALRAEGFTNQEALELCKEQHI